MTQEIQRPKDRLETALTLCIKDAATRLMIRRIYESEMKGASVFWNEGEGEVELLDNTRGITFWEH